MSLTIAQIRTKFKEATGRYDLSDTDIDYFINEGQKMLDRKVNIPNSYKWHKEDVASGVGFLKIKNCRAIKEVWMMNADGRFQLTKKALGWILETYADALADTDAGKPLYFAPAVIGLEPAQAALTSADYTGTFTYDADGILFSDVGDPAIYNAIVWRPPTDGVYTVSILGLFSSIEFADDIKTYWTENESHLLILSGSYKLELFYRNQEGASAILSDIKEALADIDKDNVEQDISGASQMIEELE